jgi:hypothetical protein
VSPRVMATLLFLAASDVIAVQADRVS